MHLRMHTFIQIHFTHFNFIINSQKNGNKYSDRSFFIDFSYVRLFHLCFGDFARLVFPIINPLPDGGLNESHTTAALSVGQEK